MDELKVLQEESVMKHVTIAIPCKGTLQARFTLCLFHVVNQLQTKTGYKPVLRFLIGKSNIVHARSILLTEWYDAAKEDDVFLFLDSDQTFALEDIEEILKQDGDVCAGIYVNGAGFPTCYPMDTRRFQDGKDKRLLYSGCGFMLIRKPIVTKIVKQLETEGPLRFAVSRDGSSESSVIPFFQPKLLQKSELTDNGTPAGDWLGEDYSFCWRVRQAGGTIHAFFSRTLGHEIPQVSLLPQGYFPSSQPKYDERTIVIFCAHTIVKFCPEMKSLGGSEKAVVEMAREWTKLGYTVSVYGNVWEGKYEGVEYKDSREFNPDAEYDTLILWRSFGASALPLVKAKRIWIDLHDVPTVELFSAELLQQKHAKLCVKSNFHRSLFPHLPDSVFFIQPNGLEVELLEKRRPVVNRKESLRFIWTSSYDRGLDMFLEKGWPLVRKAFPTATLQVFYGNSLCTSEFQAKMKHLFEQMKTEGVTDHGRCDMDRIVAEKWKSSYHVYVSEFPEIDCLSLRESVYAGCIPLCASHAVFTERPCLRVGEGLGSSVYTSSIWEQIVSVLQRLESDPTAKDRVLKYLQDELKTQKLQDSWSSTAKLWIEHLYKTF